MQGAVRRRPRCPSSRSRRRAHWRVPLARCLEILRSPWPASSVRDGTPEGARNWEVSVVPDIIGRLGPRAGCPSAGGGRMSTIGESEESITKESDKSTTPIPVVAGEDLALDFKSKRFEYWTKLLGVVTAALVVLSSAL